MKELSIEQKAKAYDEALERAKEIIECSKNSESKEVRMVFSFFPELKESEGERIRKELIDYFKENNAALAFKGISNERVIAWLENQGEQKPADKVEPKFKAGDWVIDKQNIVHQIAHVIKTVTYNTYYYDIVGGGYFNDNTEGVRLWTIQDAKDGDVLSFNDGHGNDCIDLIKSVTDEKIEFWFCLTNGNRYEVFDGITPYTNLVSREDATPATKEQRDLLFQKMKEAGYEWDADKKELKKSEKKPVKNPKFKVGDFIQFNGMGHTRYTVKEVCGLSHYINTCNKRMDMSYTDANFELVEQKPVWSEEDKRIIDNLISQLGNLYARKLIKEETKDKYVNWLKSLKDRVQPQNRWNDISVIPKFPCDILFKYPNGNMFIFRYLEHGKVNDYQTPVFSSLEEGKWIYLNDIGCYNRWKPSKIQMEALNMAIGEANQVDTAAGENIAGILSVLYDDLEKL